MLKCGRQTADTFQAAATFFELVNIWGMPDTEIQAKIKYAKWNAVRIAKAIKEGKDPNESNPKPQPKVEPIPPIDTYALDEAAGTLPDRSRHATVQDVPDKQDQFNEDITHVPVQAPVRASSSSPMRAKPEIFSQGELHHTDSHNDNVSPLESSHSNDRSGSVGGGFFPLPTFTAESNNSTLPTAPPDHMNDLVLPEQPSFAPGSRTTPPPPRPEEPQDYYHVDPPHVHPSRTNISQVPTSNLVPQQPQNFQNHEPFQYSLPLALYSGATQPPPIQSRVIGANLVEVDDEAIAQAQKHARWAISALNFEDTQTAIKELREALRTLGAEP